MRKVGAGIAAVTCCHPRQLLWSDDGVSFAAVTALPAEHRTILDVDAILDGEGRPRTWLLATQGLGPTDDPDFEWWDEHTLWRFDGDAWARVAGPEPVDTSAFTLATSGPTAFVIRPVTVDEDSPTGELRTWVSTDEGVTWSEMPGTIGPIESCHPAVAELKGAFILSCEVGDVTGLWWARLPVMTGAGGP